ncbi:MAG: UbiX family flavin prenyltransferase [Alistipes sp.]|nr:UbiX family flavin prenyltransferase [Alistipes sp.]
MRVIVAVTAASGAIYARQCVELLLKSGSVERIALIYSGEAQSVAKAEGVEIPEDNRIDIFSNDNMWASPASGSARWDSMIIVPSTMGTIGRIASGVSQSLIERAADVMLKERRRLVIVAREAPYSLIHLRNMTTLTEAGAIIIPASPSFYFRPESIEELCLTISRRAVELAGVAVDHREWGN